MIVLDTDHLSELQRRDSKPGIKLRQRLQHEIDRTIVATIISIDEQIRGRLAVISASPAGRRQVLPYLRLGELMTFYSNWDVLPFDDVSAELFHVLKTAKIRIGTMDLKIAAIVLTHTGTLLSANLRDFRQVPNLSVEDWLV